MNPSIKRYLCEFIPAMNGVRSVAMAIVSHRYRRG